MDIKKPKHSLTMDKPPAPTPHVPLEKSKVDSNTTQATRKISGDKGTGSKSLGKLSKSQDNLASQLRRKAVAEALQKKDSGNKENVNFREKSASPGPKSKSRSTGIPVRKSHSAHSIEKSATPIKRAQSVQNIEQSSNSATATNTKTGSTVKKAQSAHNVSTTPGQVRLPTHSQNIMAYSAELLASFEKEKKILEERISKLIQQAECRKTELERCKFEIKNLKEQVHSEEEIEMIRSENHLLKDRLNELGVSVEHITDSEKLLRQQRLAESSPDEARGGRGESGDSMGGSDLGHSLDFSSCVTPEHASSLSFDNCNWDRQSNKSSDALSEISMACLQDRILQMEENHYSTSEELQATLQELSDLQDAVNELTGSNEQLGDEKQVLLESLCTQTEKLENCRMQIEHLKVLLVSDNEKDRTENERQLVLLVKSAQVEREELLLKQGEMINCIASLENETREQQDVINALRDKARILEMKNESLLSDKRAMDTQIIEVKQQESKAQIEIQKLKSLLENEKAKVSELEQFRNATDKSDLEELLDNARQEKDRIEQKLTDAQQKCAISQSTVSRLTERINSLEEDMKVCKNNAKTEISDVIYKLESTEREKLELQQEVEGLREHIDQLQMDCDRYIEESASKSMKISELQEELKALRQSSFEMEIEVKELRNRFSEEKEEWKQFQSDLQMAVRIANDYKMEAVEQSENIVSENQTLLDQNKKLVEETRTLQSEVEKLKEGNETIMRQNDIRGKVMSTVDRELAVIRQGRKQSDPKAGNPSLSVKHIIASIEHQIKPSISTPPMSPPIASCASSRRNSTDSSISINSMASLKSDPSPTKLPLDRSPSAPIEAQYKGLLRNPESKDTPKMSLGHRHTITGMLSPISPVGEEKKISPQTNKVDSPDCNVVGKKPLASILKEPVRPRRNSFSDSENKTDATKSLFGTHGVLSDPLAALAKQMGGSKRNALLKWCQHKTTLYPEIDITNFSSSWNDGLAFCALMHCYLPDRVPYKELNSQDKRRNFTVAFKAAESLGIESILNIGDMVAMERPDWQAVMSYVTSIYKHFEVDQKS